MSLDDVVQQSLDWIGGRFPTEPPVEPAATPVPANPREATPANVTAAFNRAFAFDDEDKTRADAADRHDSVSESEAEPESEDGSSDSDDGYRKAVRRQKRDSIGDARARKTEMLTALTDAFQAKLPGAGEWARIVRLLLSGSYEIVFSIS